MSPTPFSTSKTQRVLLEAGFALSSISMSAETRPRIGRIKGLLPKSTSKTPSESSFRAVAMLLPRFVCWYQGAVTFSDDDAQKRYEISRELRCAAKRSCGSR